MLAGLKVSSLACKCYIPKVRYQKLNRKRISILAGLKASFWHVFYRPEHNAKREPHRIEL